MRRVYLLAGATALLLALGLLGRRRPAGEAPPEWRVPALEALTDIHLEATGRKPTHLRRSKGGWGVQPSGAALDAKALEALEAVLAEDLRCDYAEVPPKGDLAPYGIGEHSLKVELVGRAGRTRFRLGKVIDGRRSFVLPEGEQRVHRVRGNLARALDRRSWQEARLFPSQSAAKVAQIELLRSGRLRWRAEREAAEQPWRLLQPAGLAAGQAELHAVANTLATARSEVFVEAAFRPAFEIRARTFAGDSLRLLLGPRAENGSALAQRPGGPVTRLPNHLLTFLDVEAEQLRERRLITTQTPIVELVFAAPVRLRIQKTQADWRIDGRPLPPGRGEALTGALQGLRALGFPPKPPDAAFDQVWQRVELRLEDDRVLRLQIGAEMQRGARYARVDEGPVAILGPRSLEALRPSAEALLSAGPAGGSPPRP